MKIKLPENFGGISVDGVPVKLQPNKKGVVEAEDGIAQLLLTHGAVLVESGDAVEV